MALNLGDVCIGGVALLEVLETTNACVFFFQLIRNNYAECEYFCYK